MQNDASGVLAYVKVVCREMEVEESGRKVITKQAQKMKTLASVPKTEYMIKRTHGSNQHSTTTNEDKPLRT